jgi:UDP:flavonoid glycosyltransferase YjiC (YdhE family)
MGETKRIILSTFGSFGDIHPYMAIARELQQRGHDPVIGTMGLYREKIEAAGLRFAAVRPDLAPPQEQDQELIEKIMEPKTGAKFLLEKVIFPAVRDSYADLMKLVADHHLLVTHPTTLAGPLVAYKVGLPWISTVLAPTSFMSAYDPPVPPFWPWLVQLKLFGPTFVKLLIGAAKKGYQPRAVNRFRDELGISDYGNAVFEGQHSPEMVLALFSSLFAQPQPDWPANTHVTGFPFFDDGDEELSPELLKFLDGGAPPIIFTLGSSAVWVARDFYEQSIAAATALGRRAVLVIGDQRNLPAESLPPHIMALDYAHFESLLPLGCAMVHHGGVGTTAQGLRSGIPTLIVPFAFDQPDNAAHAARLGTSRTLYRARYNTSTATRELGILLQRPHYAENAKAVGETLRRENGAAAACDLIEAVLLKDRAMRQESRELIYASGN